MTLRNPSADGDLTRTAGSVSDERWVPSKSAADQFAYRVLSWLESREMKAVVARTFSGEVKVEFSLPPGADFGPGQTEYVYRGGTLRDACEGIASDFSIPAGWVPPPIA